jgi:gluconokinase
VALSAATSGAMRVLVTGVPKKLPAGLWCYHVDASRSLLGGALNDVGRAISWLTAILQISPEFDLNESLLARPEPDTPLVLPFFSGERSTGWAADARTIFSGVSAATTAAILFRGTVEGVAVSYARIAEQLHAVAGETRRSWRAGGSPRICPRCCRSSQMSSRPSDSGDYEARDAAWYRLGLVGCARAKC